MLVPVNAALTNRWVTRWGKRRFGAVKCEIVPRPKFVWAYEVIRHLCLSRQLHDPKLVCTDKQFLPIGDPEFVENAGEVVTDRNARDA
jgi:hypothetical protein